MRLAPCGSRARAPKSHVALPLSVAFAAGATLLSLSRPAPAAQVFQCGPGSPNVQKAKCDCPAGHVERTEGPVSKCVPVGSNPGTSQSGAACSSDMTKIPGGKLTPSWLTTSAAAQVTLVTYCLDTNEVTVSDYKKCFDAKGCTEPEPFKVGNEGWKFQGACNWKHPDGRGQHPVNCVKWQQAADYCKWAGKRLPSEEEWEYAARNGDKKTMYAWGNDKPNETRVNACGSECAWRVKSKYGKDWKAVWYASDPFQESAPVGSFPLGDNRWGVHDLGGNVWEWTTGTDGNNKVDRGGSWLEQDVKWLLATARESLESYKASPAVGFRCAKTP